MKGLQSSLSVAYVMQNAGNDLAEDVGPAIVIKRTVRGLQRAGHCVSVLRLNGRTVRRIDDPEQMSGAESVPLGLSGARVFRAAESAVRRVQRELRFPYLALFDSFRFYEACSRALPRYALCHEYGGPFSIGAALACRRHRIPHILTVEGDSFVENEVKGSPLRGLRAAFAARNMRLNYRLTSKILTVSEPVKQRLVEVWGVEAEKIVVMPNGVDTELFRPLDDGGNEEREAWGLGEGPVVIFVGGFQAWHGLEDLLEAFKVFQAAVPEARLLLVGDGPMKPQIEREVNDLSLSDVVIFTGQVPQRRVPRLLAAADIALLPYPELPEELWFSPLKLYEYMAAGKAIVATRAGQITEVIEDDQNGLLVAPGNTSELAQALIALGQDRARRVRLGKNARRQAVQRHSWEQYISQLEDVYWEVVSRSNANTQL